MQAATDHGVVEFESSSSRPSDEICNYAKEHGIDMIVMGSHGRSNLEAIFVGSVSFEVVRKAHCPVTIVHLSTAVGYPAPRNRQAARGRRRWRAGT